MKFRRSGNSNGRLTKLLISWITEEGIDDEGALLDRLEEHANPEELMTGFRYWGRHVITDAMTSWRKPTGESPRAGRNSDGQIGFGWLTDPAVEIVPRMQRYRRRYVRIREHLDLFDRVLDLLEPYMAAHDVTGMSGEEVCRLAGVSEEDIAALGS